MTSDLLLMASWFGFDIPSFDWTAAVIVGTIAVAGAAIILTGGLATPFIAIQAGVTIKATMVAVAVISVGTGFVAGAAAGWYWGRQGDIEWKVQVDEIARVSNQLDIYFAPSNSDPELAKEFTCTVVLYEESDLRSRPPVVTTRKVNITAADAQPFYDDVEKQIRLWLGKRVEGDRRGHKRKLVVYMNPYPGEAVYDRLKELTEQIGNGRCEVRKNEGSWNSALPN